MRIEEAAERRGIRPLPNESKGLMEEGVSGIAATARELEFTGERIVPGKTAEALFRQHEERYVFAAQYVSGKDVLDVACGSGVGTSLLREAGARCAWGLDIDSDAIAFAKTRYRDCTFAQCDATNLCLASSSVDVVVSFETLEHLKDQRKFLMECRRVLRPGGVLICSTPNLGVSRWGPDNPYHVREFSPMEFKGLFEGVFSSTELFGQRNRMFPLYVGRKAVLRALVCLQLEGRARWIVQRDSAAGPLRERFVNDVSGLQGNIARYRRNFLRQPTFLIAVAHAAPLHQAWRCCSASSPPVRSEGEGDTRGSEL